jgi:hypothetical protein
MKVQRAVLVFMLIVLGLATTSFYTDGEDRL